MKIQEFNAHMQAAQDTAPPTMGLHQLLKLEVSQLLERRRYSDTWNRWHMDHSPSESSQSPFGYDELAVSAVD